MIKTFQIRANDILNSEKLQFTTKIWRPTKGEETTTTSIDDTFTIVNSPSFPFLDMELYWDRNDSLAFKVHMKENQVLKYLNKGSCHTSNCFKAIPNGVLKRLSKLTTRSPSNLDSKLDNLYPDHAKALRTANLAPPSFPTMREMLEEAECESRAKIAKEKRKSDQYQDKHISV